jgi:electron transfer flavoprotein alpha subunit
VTTLVIADHDHSEIKPATLAAVTAAQRIGGDIQILVAGRDCGRAATRASGIAGVSRVLLADDEQYADHLAEPLAALIVSLAGNHSHLLHAATLQGKDVMPRVAALLKVSQISDISAVLSDDTFVRPIYAGSILATVRSAEVQKVITVRASSFQRADISGATAPIVKVSSAADPALSMVTDRAVSKSVRPELASASIVVAGGRGLGSAENFRIIETLADTIGAAVGASRAAVDAGFASNDRQVGQTGTIVAPELYIAIGISGAIQHLAGIHDARIIVAINNDAEAPIFEVADYGLVGDLFDVVPLLTSALGGSRLPTEDTDN